MLDLKLNDTIIGGANNSNVNSDPKMNCFYDIPDNPLHAKVGVKISSISFNIGNITNTVFEWNLLI